MLALTYIPKSSKCNRCGQVYLKKSANAKFCEKCRPIRAREYMAKAQAKRRSK